MRTNNGLLLSHRLKTCYAVLCDFSHLKFLFSWYELGITGIKDERAVFGLFQRASYMNVSFVTKHIIFSLIRLLKGDQFLVSFYGDI